MYILDILPRILDSFSESFESRPFVFHHGDIHYGSPLHVSKDITKNFTVWLSEGEVITVNCLSIFLAHLLLVTGSPEHLQGSQLPTIDLIFLRLR